MIWNLPQPAPATPPGLCAYLEGELAAAFEPGQHLPAYLPDLARAVTEVCAACFPAPALPQPLLRLLVARVLWETGECTAGERALGRVRTPEVLKGNAVHDLFSRGGPNLETCILLAKGVLKPASSSVAGVQPSWVLDCGKLLPGRDGDLDLLMQRGARLALEQSAEIWEAGDGAGSLGLAGPAEGCDPGALRGFCAAVLEKVASRRGWGACPGVFYCRLRG